MIYTTSLGGCRSGPCPRLLFVPANKQAIAGMARSYRFHRLVPRCNVLINNQVHPDSLNPCSAANPAGRILAQRAARDAHVQRVQCQQPAAQAACYADQQLERFRRLPCADDTHQWRENASGRAAQLGGLAVLGEQAVVAGRVIARENRTPPPARRSGSPRPTPAVCAPRGRRG